MTPLQQNVEIPEQLERALGFNVIRLASLFKKELLKALATDDMSAEQWQVLATLWWTDSTSLTQVQLCNLTLKDKPTVSRMVSVMIKRDWVKKIPSDFDARATYIVLTPNGKKLKDEISKKLMNHFSPLLGGLTSLEHSTLLTLLKKTRKAFGD